MPTPLAGNPFKKCLWIEVSELMAFEEAFENRRTLTIITCLCIEMPSKIELNLFIVLHCQKKPLTTKKRKVDRHAKRLGVKENIPFLNKWRANAVFPCSHCVLGQFLVSVLSFDPFCDYSGEITIPGAAFDDHCCCRAVY